jgi:gliding motility-associated-like protein
MNSKNQPSGSILSKSQYLFPPRWLYNYITCGLLVCVALLGSSQAAAQPFTQRILPGVDDTLNITAEANWADVDNDGDLDVLMNRYGFPQHDVMFLNNNNVFSRIATPQLMSSYFAGMVFGDMNQDGRLDLLGPGSNLHLSASFYPFDGCSYRLRATDFFTYPDFALPISYGCAWGDYDGDGDMDAIYMDSGTGYTQLRVFRQDNGTFTATASDLGSGGLYDVSWEDYDRDGDLDILLNSRGIASNHPQKVDIYETRVFRNDEGSFRRLTLNLGYQPGKTLVHTAQWADVDGDGFLDIVQNTGAAERDGTQTGFEVYLYRDGTFVPGYNHSVEIEEGYIRIARVEPGDIDHDGDIDVMTAILLSSTFKDPYRYYFMWYYNQGNGQFRPDLTQPSTVASHLPKLLDYDRDGDLDISSARMVLENNLNPVHAKPAAPAGLTASVQGNMVTLAWQPATDPHFPVISLTYNVHVTNALTGLTYLNGQSHLVTGSRSVLRRGNAGARTQKLLPDLPDGTYYWTVQTVNGNFEASAYSVRQSFTIANGQVTPPAISLGSFQWLSTCECNPMEMEIETTGAFGSGNKFFLQLSDSTGSFDQPTVLFDNYYGDKAGYYNGIKDGRVSGWVPRSVKEGGKYRVRVVSTNPSVASPDNGYDVGIRKAPEPPIITMLGSQKMCINPSDSRFACQKPARYANSYEWVLLPAEAGVITGQGLTAEVNWNDNFFGKAYVSLRGVNGCGPGSLSAPVQVDIYPSVPEAPWKIHGAQLVCPDNPRLEYRVDTIRYADEYIWQLPQGVYLTESKEHNKRVTLNFTAAFTGGEVQVYGRNSCGDGNKQALLLKTYPNVPAPGIITGPDTVCVGASTVVFSVPSVENAQRYLWKLPPEITEYSGTISTPENKITVYLGRQRSHGAISVAAANDCDTSAYSPVKVLTILDQPVTPTAVYGPLQVCPGSTAEYSVATRPDASGYEWSLPKGFKTIAKQTTSSHNTIIVAVDTTFWFGVLSVRELNKCGVSDFSTNIRIDSKPYLKPPTLGRVCNTLRGNHEGSYPVQWYLDGGPIPGATRNEIEISRKGEYSLHVTGVCNVASTTVMAEPFVNEIQQVPNVFTPNGDGKNETFQLPDKLLGSHLTVLNRWGKVVFEAVDYQNGWRGEDLPGGIYYYQLKIACIPSPIRGIIHLLR